MTSDPVQSKLDPSQLRSPQSSVEISRTVVLDKFREPAKISRWSGYAWVFAREKSNLRTSSRLAPSFGRGGQYGASQAGVILSYRISDNVDRDASLFVRGSSSLVRSGEEEIAIGAKFKPFGKIPISIHVEQRLGSQSNRNRGAAVYAAGGTNPKAVLGGLKLETYGQAGYVFDDRDSYFFDGSATLQMNLAKRDRKAISFGTGIWTGGQRGVARLDVGPRLDIRLPVADTMTRLSVDWRQRVAGQAQPGSGVAITLSAGF